MIRIMKNKAGCIVLWFDDEKTQLLEIEIQEKQYVAKRGAKTASRRMKKEPIKLQSSKTEEAYFVVKEQDKIRLFNEDGLDIILR